MAAIELRTERETDRIALRGVRVKAKIAALSVKATLEQTFVNLEDRAIEAVYTFPLPEGAAVCGFEVITGDRVLTGKIDETDAAMKQYDDAIEVGHAAFTLESDRPDVFTVRVGNLKPRQAATIRISYVSALERVDRSIRVAFPTTVAPRYATTGGMNPIDAAIEGDALNPPHVWQVPYGLSMEVEVDLAQKVRSVSSPTHDISPSPGAPGEGKGEGSSRITMACRSMDRDIVLSIELEQEHAPSVDLVKDSSGDQFVAVSFVPEFDVDELSDPKPSETVFVLDCSGSMQGESIAQATLALELCLRALNPNDYFNICRFGSTFEMMSSEPLKYSSETLDRAIQYVQHGADLGGTELLGPLQAIVAAKPQAGVRNVVLLTDGQVSNEPAIIELARKFRANHRIFSFGIGSACSAYLVKGLARATSGASEFISGTERIEEKVLRTFSRIASPMLTDVHIDFGGAEVQTLAEISPVFDGEVMTTFGKVAGSRMPKQVSLRGDLRGESKSWTVDVPFVHDDAERLISTLWARRMIQSIEEVNSITRSAVRSNETRERKLLIELSKQYNVLCSLTTFVAIEHRSIEDRNDGKPELRRVPVQLAHGWGGVHAPASAAGVVMACMAPAPASLSRMAKRSASSSVGRTIDRLRDAFTQRSQPPAARYDAQRFVERIESSTRSELSHLLCLQQAEGFFKPDKMIDRCFVDVGLSWKDEWVNNHHPIDPRVKATVMALKVLRSHFTSDESLWKRAVAKAEKWLAVELHLKVADLQKSLA